MAGVAADDAAGAGGAALGAALFLVAALLVIDDFFRDAGDAGTGDRRLLLLVDGALDLLEGPRRTFPVQHFGRDVGDFARAG